MIITLTKPVEKIIVPAEIATLTTLTIDRIVDLPQEKTVKIFIRELREFITLWEGGDYDTIGQWTNTDVEAKLNILFSA